jgi:hypothetical protein
MRNAVAHFRHVQSTIAGMFAATCTSSPRQMGQMMSVVGNPLVCSARLNFLSCAARSVAISYN